MGRRPAERELPSQQASGSLHDEAWAGRVGCLSLTISQEVEIETVCVVTVSYLPSPDFATSSPGPGGEVRSWIGWTPLEKNERSGVWLILGALQEGGVFPALSAAGDWVRKESCHTALLVFVWAWHSCRATNYWRAVLATALWTVEGYRTPDDAMVC